MKTLAMLKNDARRLKADLTPGRGGNVLEDLGAAAWGLGRFALALAVVPLALAAELLGRL